jgi:cell filamentation protein
MSDTYIDPETGILRNKLGLRTQKELSEAEYAHTINRSMQLSKKPIQGNFDLKHLQAIHKHQFHDVYEWAGKLRTVNISKGNTLFARTEYLESCMKDIHRNLEKNNFLRGMDKKEFVQKFTDVYGDINALHPFREGNGRTTRQFMAQLAEQAGYTLDQSIIEKNKDEWNKVSEQSNFGRMEPLKAILNDAIQQA